MKSPHSILAGSFLATLLMTVLPLALTAAPAKEEVLIDFTDVRVDHTISEAVLKCYEYAWDDWGKHISNLPRKGCLVQSPTNKGCVGEDRTSVKFDGSSLIYFDFLIGSANSAKAINLSLEDSDGTEQSWAIPLESLIKGRLYHFPLDLTKCTTETKPGKKPGLNRKKISTWQIKGDWSDTKTEILLIKVLAGPNS